MNTTHEKDASPSPSPFNIADSRRGSLMGGWGILRSKFGQSTNMGASMWSTASRGSGSSLVQFEMVNTTL